jgi:hypothetical protein
MTREEFIKEYELDIFENGEIIRLFDEKAEEYGKLVEQHRKSGDFIEFWLEERDKNKNIYSVIHSFATEQERNEYYKELIPHIRKLIENHIIENDLDQWVLNLKKNDNSRYEFVIDEENVQEALKNIYKKIFDEHRKIGDLIDYLWDLSEEFNLSLEAIDSCFTDDKKKEYPLEGILYDLAEFDECQEVRSLEAIVSYYIEKRSDFNSDDYNFKFIFNLSQAPKDSIEYKRYQKIRSKIGSPRRLEKLDKCIAKTILMSHLRKIGIIVGVAFILILTAVIVIHNIATKDARLAKKEQQRIEKQQKIDAKNLKKEQQRIAEQEAIDALNDAKNLKKTQSDDVKLLESLGNVKLSQQDLLISTSEPVMYVLAPMTYDTTKFVADASRESGSFGKTVDNSKERLMLLEICITDFESKIDAKTGVSFLDRSKIAQIENEHEFQLGDWSNNKKTAEIGKALNSNVLLFLDKFGYIDSSYHFEAKFVDINTMKSSVYSVVYKNPKSKVKTPEIVDSINFKDFTAVSTKKNPFDDEITLSAAGTVRTSQRLEYKNVCPFGSVAKLDFSEYDVNSPNDEILKAKELYFDGFGRLEITSDEGTENLTYSFEPVEMNLIRDGDNYYTDGKIGTLVLKDGASYKNYDVFTQNCREYFVRLGSENLDKVQVNYFVRFSKE